MSVIRALDNEVVNRIAAGEVIQRPMNALKELLENSLDAGATKINVVLKDGGLKLLQITDNGSGIHPDDFPILCNRFTTSKLKEFSDLQSIGTFGFRGEALASITYVSRVTITSMKPQAPCAYTAEFFEGKLLGSTGKPSASAGVQGTMIRVEDLFFNTPMRKHALRSGNDEYTKCLQVVMRYALHYSGVAFSCKKHGSNTVDVNTHIKASTQSNLRSLFGAQIGKEVVIVGGERDDLKMKITGYATNANYSQSKLELVLFINNRLVESVRIKTTLDRLYAQYLPKGTHPFVYLSLVIAPENVDVNVHPTKNEVLFLQEEETLEFVENVVQKALISANESRTFQVTTIHASSSSSSSSRKQHQTSLSLVETKKQQEMTSSSDDSSGDEALTSSKITKKKKKEKSVSNASKEEDEKEDDAPVGSVRVRSDVVDLGEMRARKKTKVEAYVPKKKVRMDSRTMTLDAFINTNTTASQASKDAQQTSTSTSISSSSSMASRGNSQKRPRRKHGLASIATCIEDVKHNEHIEYLNIVRDCTYVGLLDRGDVIALLQHKTSLLLVNVSTLSRPFFYQIVLHEFMNLSRLRFNQALQVKTLLELALQQEEEHDKETIAQETERCMLVLEEKAQMLSDYYSIELNIHASNNDDDEEEEDGKKQLCLEALPQLLQHYVPPMAYLPKFLLHLAREIDWTDELRCLRGIALLLADFYKFTEPERYGFSNHIKTASSADDDDSIAADGTREKWQKLEWIIQHAFVPALRVKFKPPQELVALKTFTNLVRTEDLYKIFERC